MLFFSLSRAPGGCLQYFTGTSGNIASFNAGTTGALIDNLLYSICLRKEAGKCSANFYVPISSITMIVIQCLFHWIGLILKYRSKQISPQCCRCYIFLGLTFVEIKNPVQKCFYLLILRILEYFFLGREQIKMNLSNVLML